MILLGFWLAACELMGDAKVSPIISQGPPMAALDSQVDIERVAALVPAENSYANKTTSISFKVSGTCISGSVAVLIQIETNSISVNLSCNETTGEFSTAIDLSAILDGPLVISISYLKTVVSTAPIYVLQRNIVKDTVNPTGFSIPASFTESAGAISFSSLDGAALYRATFTPNGGGPAVTIESTNSNIVVSSLNVGVTYTVSITAFDAAGNETPSSNTGTFTKTDTDPPVFSSFSLAGDAANGYISNAEKNGSSALAGSLVASGQTSTKYAVGGSAAACSTMTFGVSIPTAADLTLGDVSYQICVELKDSANNTTYGATSAFSRDIVAPTVNAGADFAVNSTQAANNNLATASGYSTLLWANQSTGVGSITFDSTSSLTNTVLASANGAYTLRLTASDAAGNSALDDTVLTWSGLGGGGGGGGGGYAIYVPFIMDTTPYIASWTIASNNTTDAAGTGNRATLPKGTWSSTPDAKSLMSIAGKSNGTMSVVYLYAQGSSNNILRGAIVNPDLTLPSIETPDSAATMQVASVDVAVDSGGLFNYFYSVGNHSFPGDSSGMYSLRRSISGDASNAFRAGATALPYTDVFARIDSNNKPEVMAMKPTNFADRIISRSYDTGSDQSTPYSCGSGNPGALTAAWITKGDDYFIGTNCSSDSKLYVTDNKSRSSGGVVYTKTRGSVSTSSGITASSFMDYQILDDNDQADLYYVSVTGPGYYIKYCPASNCATPTQVYFSGTEAIHSVRAVRAADGTVFVVATVGADPNRLIFIRKTGTTTFSSAASYTMNGSVNLTMKIGKRIFEASSPGNSNWTKRHTLFVTQYSHYGDMTTSTDTVTKLAPDALCRGYAFGARLPRPQSTVAVIQGPLVSFASQVGTLSGDVYTNESTPTVFKTQAAFSNGVDPAPGKFVTDSGTALTAPSYVWAGDVTTGGDDCRGMSSNPWTSGSSAYNGLILTVGTGFVSNAWFSASTSLGNCNATLRLMCITK